MLEKNSSGWRCDVLEVVRECGSIPWRCDPACPELAEELWVAKERGSRGEGSRDRRATRWGLTMLIGNIIIGRTSHLLSMRVVGALSRKRRVTAVSGKGCSRSRGRAVMNGCKLSIIIDQTIMENFKSDSGVTSTDGGRESVIFFSKTRAWTRASLAGVVRITWR
ncbi:unnamed protein product [Linum trigynum]|uniref:Uncharacterized protein n=1 Tax=Linum trigynum TaxID=586398 RepID=A0AAV2FX71_9ROSI